VVKNNYGEHEEKLQRITENHRESFLKWVRPKRLTFKFQL